MYMIFIRPIKVAEGVQYHVADCSFVTCMMTVQMLILYFFKLLESTVFVQFYHLESGPKFRIQRVYHHLNSMINSLN